MVTTLTPEQEADARTRDVMAFAYRDTDGKLYSVNQSGQRIEAPEGTPALSAQYQKVAERTAALVITYNKILNLTPQERGKLADLASGKLKVDEAITGGLREAWEGLKSASQDSGVVPNIPGAGLVTTGLGLASSSASGVGLIPTFLGDVRQLISNLGDQVGGGIISRENAIAIGTAYASARQVVASGRPLEPGVGDYFKGLFSSHFLSYAGAGLAWLLDIAVGFAENIPGIGDWIKEQGWAKHQTLAQHIEASMRDDDNVEVASEIGELDRLGGRDAKETATLLTTGGTVRDGAGNPTPVAPADSASETPTGPGGEAAPATPDAALAAAEKTQKPFLSRVGTAISDSFTNTSGVLGAAGPVGAVVGSTIFGVGAFRAGAGFVGKINHMREVAPAVDLYKEYTAAKAAIPALKSRVEHAKAGTRASWLSFGVEDTAEAKANLATAKARVTTLQADLAEMGVDVESKAFRKMPAAERLASVAEQRYAHLSLGTAAEQRAGWLASNVDKARNPLNPMRWPGMWGRGAGYATVATADAGTSIIGGITTRLANWGGGIADEVRGWWGGGSSATTATATADAAADATEEASKARTLSRARASLLSGTSMENGPAAAHAAFANHTRGVTSATAEVADAATTVGSTAGRTAGAASAAAEVAETAAHAAPAAARSASALSRAGAAFSRINGGGRWGGALKIGGAIAAVFAGSTLAAPASASADNRNTAEPEADNSGERNTMSGMAVGSTLTAGGAYLEARRLATAPATAATPITQSQSIMGRLARWGGRAMSSLGILTTGANAASDFATGDNVGGAVNTVGAATLIGGAAKLGLSRAAPLAAPVVSGIDYVSAARRGDSRGMSYAGTDLAIIGTSAATGAALGLCGGPFAPLSVPAGALIGTTVGGFITLGRGVCKMFSGEDSSPQVAATPAQPTRPAAPAQTVRVAMTPEEVMRGQDTVRDQVRMAIHRGGSAQGGFSPNAFASVRSTAMGAANPQGNPAGSGARPQGAAVNV